MILSEMKPPDTKVQIQNELYFALEFGANIISQSPLTVGGRPIHALPALEEKRRPSPSWKGVSRHSAPPHFVFSATLGSLGASKGPSGSSGGENPHTCEPGRSTKGQRPRKQAGSCALPMFWITASIGLCQLLGKVMGVYRVCLALPSSLPASS